MLVPAAAASTSPQYRSLHHDTLHPPSASAFDGPGAFCDCCKFAEFSACVTRGAGALSCLSWLCVGVEIARVFAPRVCADDGGSDDASMSSHNCQVVSEGCSKHS